MWRQRHIQGDQPGAALRVIVVEALSQVGAPIVPAANHLFDVLHVQDLDKVVGQAYQAVRLWVDRFGTATVA